MTTSNNTNQPSSNQTEAPTSQATKDALTKQSGAMNTEQLAFVSFVHQYYSMTGNVLSLDVAVDEYDFDPAEFSELFANELVQRAIAERGIINRDIENTAANKWATKHGLTPLQLLAANAMMDMNDTRSNKKKLQDLGVSTAIYAQWLKDRVFNQYMTRLGESLLTENQHEAMLSLIERVRQGDSKALETYFEMTGRFVKTQSGASPNVEQQDFKSVLIKILEIINDEVNDPDTAMRISERLKGLISAQSMANQIIDTTPIEKPTIRSMNSLPAD